MTPATIGLQWTKLLDLIAPRSCLVCQRRLDAAERVLCHHCEEHLPFTDFEQRPLDNAMARLFWGLAPVERAAALFFFDPGSEVANLIYELKYHDAPDVGIALGQLVARRFEGSGFFLGIDALVPVPLTKPRQRHRGYNQSEMIARGIALQTGLNIDCRLLERIRFSGSQTHVSQQSRRDNVADAFRLHPKAHVGDRHLLLIDDIVTTGSTLAACAQQLAEAGHPTLSYLTLGFTSDLF